ncbi:MAG: RNA polymerase sigma factor [Planctomycetota bacterium]
MTAASAAAAAATPATGADAAHGNAPTAPTDAASTEQRLRAFFDASADELLGTARGLLHQHHDAVEVFQETFLKCWQRRHLLGDVRNLRAFVFTVLVNTARDEQRRRQRRPVVPLETDLAAVASPVVGVEIERGELVELVREAIDKLRPEDREVFLLRQNGELAYHEIAEMLGLPEGTVKTRMRKALIRLREVLDRHPGTRTRE